VRSDATTNLRKLAEYLTGSPSGKPRQPHAHWNMLNRSMPSVETRRLGTFFTSWDITWKRWSKRNHNAKISEWNSRLVLTYLSRHIRDDFMWISESFEIENKSNLTLKTLTLNIRNWLGKIMRFRLLFVHFPWRKGQTYEWDSRRHLKEWRDKFSKVWRVPGRRHLLQRPRRDVLQERLHHAGHGLRLVAEQDEEHAGQLEGARQGLDLVAVDEKHHNVLRSSN